MRVPGFWSRNLPTWSFEGSLRRKDVTLSVSCNAGLQWTVTQRGIMGSRLFNWSDSDKINRSADKRLFQLCMNLLFQETSWKREREIMWGGARRRNLSYEAPLCLGIVFWACEKTVKFLLMCVRQPGLKTWRSPALVCFICHPRVLSSEAISKQSARSLINMDELW